MDGLLNWDRDDHFAVDHGFSGISRKTVRLYKRITDIGFAAYPAGELFCQFLNYDFSAFADLKRRRDGRSPVPDASVVQLLSEMPYYRDLMQKLPGQRKSSCAQQFSRWNRGQLWQDAEACFRLIQSQYRPLADRMCQAQDAGQPALSALAGLALFPTQGSSSSALPAPVYLIDSSREDPVLAEEYRLSSLTELLSLDLLHFLRRENCLQKCRNCGRYFLPQRGYNYRYCSQIAPGFRDRTCRDIGAASVHRSKLAESSILTEYQRAYKRYYARILKHRWSKDDFRLWQDRALSLREEALEQSWTAERFSLALQSAAEELPAGK